MKGTKLVFQLRLDEDVHQVERDTFPEFLPIEKANKIAKNNFRTSISTRQKMSE